MKAELLSRRVRATLTAATADRRIHPALRNGQLTEEVEAQGFDVLGGAPSRHLRVVTPGEGRNADAPTFAKPGEQRKGRKNPKDSRRLQAQAVKREAQARRQAERRKAEDARQAKTIDRATRQADRLREKLREVEARIDRAQRTDQSTRASLAQARHPDSAAALELARPTGGATPPAPLRSSRARGPTPAMRERESEQAVDLEVYGRIP